MREPEAARLLRHDLRSEDCPALRVELAFSSVDPAVVLDRVREVLAATAAGDNSPAWPPRAEWAAERLPRWFVEAVRFSDEQIATSTWLWSLDAWLGTMASRGWEYWTESGTSHTGLIVLWAHSDPFAMEPLVFLLRLLGAVDIRFKDERLGDDWRAWEWR